MGILIIIILLFLLLRFLNTTKEGPCVLIFANLRTGKTTLIARYAQRELKLMKKGKSKFNQIISNTPIAGCIFVPHIRKLLNETTPEKTLILVDEGGIIWNNRKMKISDNEIEYIKLIGHYQSKIIVVSQGYDDIDITLRRLYTSMYLLNKIGPVTLIRPIKRFVTIEKETEQIIDGYKFRFIFSWRIIYRPSYYGLFDTYWKPERSCDADYKEFEIVPNTKIKLTEKIKGIVCRGVLSVYEVLCGIVAKAKQIFKR